MAPTTNNFSFTDYLSSGLTDLTNLVGQAGVLVNSLNPSSPAATAPQTSPTPPAKPLDTQTITKGVLGIVALVIVFKLIA